MKTIGSGVLVSFLVLSGVALASQPSERGSYSASMRQMMQGEGHGKKKAGMMRMMKMMDRCAAMMESAQEPIKERPEE